MARTLTTAQANKRLYVTEEKHDTLSHLSIDRKRSITELVDEALEVGIRHLLSKNPSSKIIPSTRSN